jgi:hypothetical protein
VSEFSTVFSAVALPLAAIPAPAAYQTIARITIVTTRQVRVGRIVLNESMPVSTVSIAP